MALDLLIRLLFILLFPMIYLFILATFVYTRSHHIYIGKMVALSLALSGIAYFFDLVRILLPIEYSHIFQLFFVIFFSSLSFSILAHMFYKLITKISTLHLPFMPYLLYSYPFFMLVYGFLESFIISSPPYYLVDGWVYRSDYFLLPNAFFVLLIYSFEMWLFYIGIKNAKTASYKLFFKICFFYTLFCLAIIIFWMANPMRLHALLPPTPVLLFFTLTGTLYAFLITKLDFIPSIVKKHTSLIDTSPVAIIYFNQDLTILESNPAAKKHFLLSEQEKLTNYFNFWYNPQPLYVLLDELENKQYVVDFAISYYGEDLKKQHLLIDASRVVYNEEVFYFWMIHDLTLKVEQRQMNEYLAFYDPLTNIYNRTYFEQTVKQQLSQHDPTTESVFALIDLNFFKAINDTHGHQIGDAVLQFTAQILKNALPNPHILARLGGDEFVMYFENITSRYMFELELTKIRQLFKHHPFSTGVVTIEVIPSFGFAYTSEVGTNYDTLYHTCDQQMYQDKKAIKRLYEMSQP